MLGMSEEFRDELPPLNTDLFKIAYENAQSDLTKLHINDKKPLPTAEEMNEATKPIVDQYNKVLQERKVIIDKHSNELSVRGLSVRRYLILRLSRKYLGMKIS